MPSIDLWGTVASARTEGVVSVWPARPNYVPSGAPVPQGLYAGYYTDRHKRFYLRSLRRSGVYLGDLSTVVLWVGNGWAEDNGFCP
jgi:hypothetical protein